MNKHITSIEEIEQEQEKLKMTLEITRHEFARSLGTNRALLKEFMIKKVAAPAGAVGLGVFAANKVMSRNSNVAQKKTSKSLGILNHLFPFILSMIQAHLIKEQKTTNHKPMTFPTKKESILQPKEENIHL